MPLAIKLIKLQNFKKCRVKIVIKLSIIKKYGNLNLKLFDKMKLCDKINLYLTVMNKQQLLNAYRECVEGENTRNLIMKLHYSELKRLTCVKSKSV